MTREDGIVKTYQSSLSDFSEKTAKDAEGGP